MKFLCDEMLAGLGRWLRAAGYDTEIAETQMEDSKILDRAMREKRFLLTRDRHFQEMATDGKTIIVLVGVEIRKGQVKMGVSQSHDEPPVGVR